MSNAEAAERKKAGPDKSLANLTAMFDHYAGTSLAITGYQMIHLHILS